MATMEDVKQELKALEASYAEKTARYEEHLRKLEAKMGRQAIGLGGAFAAEDAGAGAWSATAEGKAFVSFLRTGETKTMSLGSDPDGGYAAPPQFASEITKVGAEQGAIRGLARVYPASTGDFHIPVNTTLAGAAWVGEGSTRGETTTPALGKIHPLHGGMAAVAPVTNWLLNDAGYDLAAFVTESIGEQFGVSESAAFVTGDGVNKPSGFLTNALAATADATRAFGTVEKLHAGSTSDFDIDDLIDLLAKLAPRYRKNACWCMHPNTEQYVRKLKASTSGDYYWQPAVAAGAPNTLLGLPCCVDVNMPTIASAAGVVAVADWRKFYAITDIGSTVLLRDQVTKKGFTLFYAEKRVGGSVVDSNAGKVLVMST